MTDQKNNYTLSIIILAIVLILIASVGSFLYMKVNQNKTDAESIVEDLFFASKDETGISESNYFTILTNVTFNDEGGTITVWDSNNEDLFSVNKNQISLDDKSEDPYGKSCEYVELESEDFILENISVYANRCK